jgi:hypothetical protein
VLRGGLAVERLEVTEVTPAQFLRAMRSVIAAVSIATAASGGAAASDFVPGLGEFMAATQMRHVKLWFAGQARNWPLAAYELDEIQEGFEDITKFHPTHEGSPVPIKEILPELTGPPLAKLRAAIRSQDEAAFDEAFDSLTEACNACHRTENFGFNVIKRPTSNPFTNQEFSSPGRVKEASDSKSGD